MNISSIVIHSHPRECADLQGRLAEMPGVDVHAALADGRIIITIEDTPQTPPSETLIHVQNLPGVLSAAMVYNYCDDMISSKPE